MTFNVEVRKVTSFVVDVVIHYRIEAKDEDEAVDKALALLRETLREPSFDPRKRPPEMQVSAISGADKP